MRSAPMRRSQPRVDTGYVEAASRYAHHMGSCEHIPAYAWAKSGDIYLSLTAEQHPNLEPHQLVSKCKAMLLNGAGWKLREQF